MPVDKTGFLRPLQVLVSHHLGDMLNLVLNAVHDSCGNVHHLALVCVPPRHAAPDAPEASFLAFGHVAEEMSLIVLEPTTVADLVEAKCRTLIGGISSREILPAFLQIRKVIGIVLGHRLPSLNRCLIERISAMSSPAKIIVNA